MGWYYEFYNKNTEEKINEGKFAYAPWMKYDADKKYGLMNITIYQKEVNDHTIFIDENSKLGKKLPYTYRGYTEELDIDAFAFDIKSAIKMDEDIIKDGGIPYLKDLFTDSNTDLIVVCIK